MEENNNNNPNEVLWTLLANPSDDASEYAYNLQRLVNDFPQSGMLQALLVHASENKNLRQAAVYFNPRSIFKLVNAPSSFVGVPDDRIVIQPGINVPGNGYNYFHEDSPEIAAAPAIETGSYTDEELAHTLPLEDMPPLGYGEEEGRHLPADEPEPEVETAEKTGAVMLALHPEPGEEHLLTEQAVDEVTEEIIPVGLETDHAARSAVNEEERPLGQAVDEVTEAVIPIEAETDHTASNVVAEEERSPEQSVGEVTEEVTHSETETDHAASSAVAEEERLPEQAVDEVTEEASPGEAEADHTASSDVIEEEQSTEQAVEEATEKVIPVEAETDHAASSAVDEEEQSTEQAVAEVTEEINPAGAETAHDANSVATEEERPWENIPGDVSHEVEPAAEEAVEETGHLHEEARDEHPETEFAGEQHTQEYTDETDEASPARAEEEPEHIEPPAELHLHEAEHAEEPVTEHEPEVEAVAAPAIEEQPAAEEIQSVAEEEPPVEEELTAEEIQPVAEEELPVQEIKEEAPEDEVEPVAEIPVEEPRPEPEILVSDDMDETFDEIVGIEDINFNEPVSNHFFEREFGAHEDVTAETIQPTAETEQQDVSKYNDEKLPYTFLWWLDKTRKEHEQAYQPYAQVKYTGEPAEKKPKRVVDELQQQYFENIFHITSVEDLDKSAPPPPPYAAHSPSPDAKRKEQVIIERFIKEEPQIKPQSSDKLDNENKAKKSSEDRDEIVTETLAVIYSEQMLYHKAISSYKKLMLKFPEKSRYFAEKIEQLEKKTN